MTPSLPFQTHFSEHSNTLAQKFHESPKATLFHRPPRALFYAICLSLTFDTKRIVYRPSDGKSLGADTIKVESIAFNALNLLQPIKI
ncbi:hypothetical protein L596_009449 [Steinernema carpocapsae]|uniref:Uncharacterized protein n=1 Tax=Steinernema carpocapsae TaxID=34508 RepID=A0A4U5PFK7_STECR|nr:hypothetical protein L596_009449 [Steinernema carpocapsae]